MTCDVMFPFIPYPFHLKSIVWHIKIDSLIAPWMKWGQNEEKCYRLIFSSLELDWADLGAHFKNFILNMVVIYQNRSFSWTINKMGSEVEKLYELTFRSGEPFWELILKFQFKYWLWRIKIDRFHWLSIKRV